MKKQPLLSLVINTKNEEQHIAACIKSSQFIADEILIVDMESTDKTVAIAKKLGARVISVPDAGFVEPARDVAITKARGKWILLIDADGRFTPSLIKKIKKIVRDSEVDVVRIPRKTTLFNRWLKHGNYWPDYQVRLFRKGMIKWPAIIHTQPIISKKVKVLNLPPKEEYAIIHYHGASIQQLAEKMVTQSQYEQFYESLSRVRIRDVYNMITGEFKARYFEHEGYKDGVAGFVAAKLREYYEFLEFAYYWQQQGFPEMFNKHDFAAQWRQQQDDVAKLEKELTVTRQQQQRIEALENELAILHDSKLYAVFLVYQKLKKMLRLGNS